MSYRWITGPSERSLGAWMPLGQRDWPWLGGVLVTGLAVAVLYVALNDYPGYGAGLYTATADQIRASGYALPETIPQYTEAGVPFAYPPLAFYGLALLRELGIGTFTAAHLVPPLFVVATLVPAYLLGRDQFGGQRHGAGTALLVAVNPQILEWHISAGGLVRTPAFFFALASAYAGLRIFRDRDRSWVPIGLVLFVLVVLTHPTYALFAAATHVVFWVGYDRSVQGLADGAVLGLGGVALTAPWWITVGSRHGFDVFTAAAGTHGGVGGGLFALLGGTSVWSLAVLGVGAVAFLGGWRVLALWLVVAEVLFQQPRFAYTVGAFVGVAAAIVVFAAVSEWEPALSEQRRTIAVVGLLVVAVGALGVVGYQYAGVATGATPAFVDDDDVEAMEWAENETHPEATFVVLGDAAEWFPAVADRTILVSPWGMEWRGPATYEQHLQTFQTASTCQSAGCVESRTTTTAPAPDYLYVPKGGYTVRGQSQTNFGTLQRSLAAQDRYEPVFENEGVVIFAVHQPDESNTATDSNER